MNIYRMSSRGSGFGDLLERFLRIAMILGWWRKRGNGRFSVWQARRTDRRRFLPALLPLEDRCLLSNLLTEFRLPNPNSSINAITVGPYGNLWFTETDAGK